MSNATRHNLKSRLADARRMRDTARKAGLALTALTTRVAELESTIESTLRVAFGV